MKNKTETNIINSLSITNKRRYMLLSFLLVILIQGIGLIPPLIMQRIIDQWIPNRNMSRVIQSAILFLSIPLIMASINTYYKYFIAVLARRSGRQLTTKAFKNVLEQKLTFFDQTNSGELATYIRQETIRYVMFWIADLPQILANFIISIIIVVFVFNLHGSFALLLLLYFPLAYFPSNYFAEKVQGMTQRVINCNGRMTQIITDSLRSIRFIKANQLKEQQVNQLQDTLDDSITIWGRIALFDNLSGLWTSNVVNQILTGVIFILSTIFVIQDQLSIGTIVVLLSYLTVFYANANNILTTNYQFKKQLAEFKPLADLINLKDIENSGSKPFDPQQSIIFKDVTFRYNQDRELIFQDLSLNIPIGKWIGIIGKSGIGKSTILDLLLGFYAVESGDLLIDGIPIDQYDLKSLRSKMAYVSQDQVLFPGTIRENLCLVKPQASTQELTDVLKKVDLYHFIQTLPQGLETPVGESGDLLSGGQKQRLNLAQALLRKTPILLLDEANAALDQATSLSIKETLTQLKETSNYTIISVSHDHNFLSECEIIYTLKNKAAEVLKPTYEIEKESRL
ncbi:ABC transporter ATP-binding protein [Facklamia sp. DSM 111018]|uniref:ABC transporter ATP-binding protein n=1 Tax=Facklamia lactis TaxID=2749967 RepID=A0ABS0LQE6_9LACT|nr:ABC transporter ATP-binding protein [Facklamia lactis]MBG9986373.1 ABC transporter ATP-binding protein [Facklamia lactis]